MKIIYHEKYNIDVGIFKFLHPFDGCKFRKVRAALYDADVVAPDAAISESAILGSVNELLKIQLKDKAALCRALEIPKIPFLSFSWLDSRILEPMRWGVAGTLAASRLALTGTDAWNLAGGYHHASPHKMEGFCIYNDIGICYQQLLASGELTATDRILIIDIDAHHGNGNARTFDDNKYTTLLDVYNQDIYPNTPVSRQRVDIQVPLPTGTGSDLYLNKLGGALELLTGGYKLAFVVAGTDVLATDPLGSLKLSIADVAQSHKLVYQRLKALNIPTVFLGGGGYGKDSAAAIVAGIKAIAVDRNKA
ncbi:MAG: histone deacetylase [Rheinheimera sp.]|uniref:histone deacetylase family protein n=1 Tax=Arsukibacterium sp. UBA3155 TaxID=1946058 RepID=UPI000C989346|nr:histone deacetylase [Arsukibacterium sp. UBA3155]MAD73294.1 histone deacetylase [Rheinheimera sp.]|tara:strand:- start:127366 stop:128286 length:921 start_codon:yes stop_codon:yes gene_type:complete